MKKNILLLPFLLVSILTSAQVYRTQALAPDIKTIQVNVNGMQGQTPIMKLNSNDYMQISFDRLYENSFNRLRYKIIHCDAEWKPSRDVSEIDYLKGFNDNWINTYRPSINTTVDYTHFDLEIPNRDVSTRLSGNYVVCIYEEDNPDKILLTACFSVLDQSVSIAANVTSNTMIDSNRGHQQISFTINQPGMITRDPFNELKVFVRQNHRLDNERKLVKPTFVNVGRFIFENNRDLIFEAGNEYRRFETTSYRYNGMNIDHIEYTRPFYTMWVVTDRVRANRSYSYDQDQNGMFFIRTHDANDYSVEADYFYIVFTLAMDEPISEDIYINGEFTDNTFSDMYKMKYDYNKRAYTLKLLLKQGLYNYQYLTKSGKYYSTAKIEGNYFETENEYTILVYYRPLGQLYDSFVGVQNIQSRKK